MRVDQKAERKTPLTPALSRGERENCWQWVREGAAWGKSERLGDER